METADRLPLPAAGLCIFAGLLPSAVSMSLHQSHLAAKQLLNDIIDEYYTYSRVTTHIEGIEKNYTHDNQLNYNNLVRDNRVGYSIIARNKTEFITGEIEQISSEYLFKSFKASN